MPSSLPEGVRSFVLEKIDSVGHLEVLSLLSKDSSKTWTAEEVSQELRTNTSLASDQLEMLMGHGLLICIEKIKYQFSPSDSEDLTRINELVKIFHDRRRVIISLIYSKPTERVRNLADAFKIRKEDL